jgi:hypothetical protein
VTRVPDFDELVGNEPGDAERERLRRAHELLVAAGPPPELTPELEAGPSLAMTLSRRRRQGRRRLALLAAAAVAVGVVFLGGYVVGNHNTGAPTAVVRTIDLRGTSTAPDALASLRIEPEDASGNWPMTLSVTGLPALAGNGYYAVYLVREGSHAWEPCGWFTVSGPHAGTTVTLNVPYDFGRGDSWVVTRQQAAAAGHGDTVLRPTA